MFTLSYPFRPWRGAEALASGESIRPYIRQTADEGGIPPRSGSAPRSSPPPGRRTPPGGPSTTAVRSRTGATTHAYTCGFLYACTGYYDYDRGYQPDFAGLADFPGRFVHPQFWPADLDHAGKRVVVIGSGATAVTLVPALAQTAAHVTMLQRSPSYVTVLPAPDRSPTRCAARLPAGSAHRLIRAKNVPCPRPSTSWPGAARSGSSGSCAGWRCASWRPGYVDEHFTPTTTPGTSGSAWCRRATCSPPSRPAPRRWSPTTSTGSSPNGVRLRSGRVLEADIVVSATGLSLLPIGGMRWRWTAGRWIRPTRSPTAG